MTESEWLGCADPIVMVEFLRSRTSGRKLRLFGCACCRTVWTLIPAVFQTAVGVAEEHADGRATDAELGAAVRAAHQVRRKRNALERAVYDAARTSGDAGSVAQRMARVVATLAAPNPSPTAIGREVDGKFVTEEIPPDAARLLWNATLDKHLWLESDLLRDIIGPLPFRPIELPAEVSTWNNGTVAALARGIYEERALGRLPILADALEAAGCRDADILDHCRLPGMHVRGCWVVDLLTGRS